MLKDITSFLDKPALYAPGTNQFWNDPYISKFVLDSHLNPDVSEASRQPDFIDRSVAWIKKIAPPSQYNALLDLGCGPGLYAERFSRAGLMRTAWSATTYGSIALQKKLCFLKHKRLGLRDMNCIVMLPGKPLTNRIILFALCLPNDCVHAYVEFSAVLSGIFA